MKKNIVIGIAIVGSLLLGGCSVTFTARYPKSWSLGNDAGATTTTDITNPTTKERQARYDAYKAGKEL